LLKLHPSDRAAGQSVQFAQLPMKKFKQNSSQTQTIKLVKITLQNEQKQTHKNSFNIKKLF